MNKQEMNDALTVELPTLKEHVEQIKGLMESLQHVTHPSGDVTFNSLDTAKEVLKNLTNVRGSLEKVVRTLRVRGQARMKDA